MLQVENLHLCDIEPSTFSQPWLQKPEDEIKPALVRYRGSGSGGYADHVFQYAAKELFGEECDKLEYKNLRYPNCKKNVLNIGAKC